MHQSREVTKLDLWIFLQPGIQIEKVNIDPTLLFSRLIAIVQREEDMAL